MISAPSAPARGATAIVWYQVGRTEASENQTIEKGERCSTLLGMAPDDAVTESVTIRLDRRKHTVQYQAGDTILETARRGGLRPPSSCEQGNCATCMAHLDAGTVTMRANNALSRRRPRRGLDPDLPVAPDERRGRRQLRRLMHLAVRFRARDTATRGTPRVRFRDSSARRTVGPEREDADRKVGDAGVAEAAQPLRRPPARRRPPAGRRRRSRRRARAGAGSSASTRRAPSAWFAHVRASSTSSLPHSATGTPATTRGAGRPAAPRPW